jgi:hypothetical protein
MPTVTEAPEAKSEPVIVTGVPPRGGPVAGETPVTVGVSAVDPAAVPAQPHAIATAMAKLTAFTPRQLTPVVADGPRAAGRPEHDQTGAIS